MNDTQDDYAIVDDLFLYGDVMYETKPIHKLSWVWAVVKLPRQSILNVITQTDYRVRRME